ncbi:8-oxo-dGTP diphosphatase MutT [Colwellia sp. 4_MG-2023]|uniref:8-oxo-dGTP diphosphatase MutT n=1 Tax=unclassified Colwellia TaxID=196834 RepID=UPI001C0822F3|nr:MULTISPECIES: 8-oxo-dGTP diphosphatase MutT [unclassified Colwellia]MBU2926216.1 8-oxo-dGTP diphosphatase MutT [Colwellia sp. C2M11]MDO6487284.1 8-oxo-dGTP diphosphatase MutT [Colwellia sp. 6_MG-2023]MDO6507187.1 8-oxo-dGTP diphosphatase MutT [Colwellia sp. 5_MG-2023]MDO6556023.1 8-oxo-dGTP diphosphatase MutT [Colwellia sp. 4_MG-2023]MDO6652362.1 8-oxo-dGTP diphosphatase MutT [Colwellia sp. 3_MG-2023]
MPKTILVAVGVIISTNEQQQTQYFLTKRLADAHQGGKWEFPGGKVEEGESVAQSLARELKEEINIDVLTCQPLITINHLYHEKEGVDKKVCLEVFIVDNYAGEPSAQEGQGEGWFSLVELQSLDFPEANQDIISALVERKI